MDPRTYCEEAVAELRRLRARRGFDPEVAQRLVVLRYLMQRSLTGAELERELERLGGQEGPAVGGAARAILVAWRDQAAVS